ncbi:MAG TPA: LLM class flavin-dependent oxidoreductase [Candidatus Binataceae bacterium]|nr:LLM class flavin-dependent oxidoreductase [Candidatus Binataceae bacterium]
MDFGIALFSNVDAWKTVKRAEELGFSHAWFYDSQLLAPDIFISMALAAEHSSKIKLASGVIIPTNRIAPVCADAFATLNKLAPGRIIFGVGTGFTGRNTMGMGPMKLSAMREYIRVVYGLLKGETIEWEFEGQRKKIRFLNPEFGMINIADKIPLHISAFAPKARKLTAEMADGWLTFSASIERATQETGDMAKACREVGRDPKTLYTTAFALGCVLKPGESPTSPRAKAQAGPMAVVTLHGMIEQSLADLLPPYIEKLAGKYREQYATYQPADAKYLQMHKMHLLGVRPEEDKFLTEDLMRETTFTATEEELRDRLRALSGAGYNQFVVQLIPGHEDAIEDWARLFAKV